MKGWLISLGVVVVIALGAGLMVMRSHKQNVVYEQGPSTVPNSNPRTAPSDNQAVSDGKRLSNNECSGTGTVALTSPPMKPDQIGIIEPYGLTTGGHVTPVDHEYYWAKNNVKDANDVMALADGRLVDIEFRSHNGQGPIPGDYRVIISYSCTFLSYFDLATSLAPDIASQLPKGWESKGSTSINIPVKAGQVVAKMGGQSLDFAVWDMTKNNPHLLVPDAYMGEPWKIHTVAPLDYFADSVKTAILPYYVRQAEPRDGTYAYDIDGKLIGTWFLKGTDGYHAHPEQQKSDYWGGHLAIAPDFIDPTVTGFSIGDYQGQATQFTVKSPVDPAAVGVDTGLVKYELLQHGGYIDAKNKGWDGLALPALPLKMPTNSPSQATALLQLTDNNTLKVEVFPGKTPAQVSDFDTNAKIYTRSGQ